MKLSENSDFSRKSSIQFYFIVVLGRVLYSSRQLTAASPCWERCCLPRLPNRWLGIRAGGPRHSVCRLSRGDGRVGRAPSGGRGPYPHLTTRGVAGPSLHRGGLLWVEPRRRALNSCMQGLSGGRSNIFFALRLCLVFYSVVRQSVILVASRGRRRRWLILPPAAVPQPDNPLRGCHRRPHLATVDRSTELESALCQALRLRSFVGRRVAVRVVGLGAGG
jgi:hypothetical protein